MNSLGRSLCDALDEMVHHGQMTPPLANEILLQVGVDSGLASLQGSLKARRASAKRPFWVASPSSTVA